MTPILWFFPLISRHSSGYYPLDRDVVLFSGLSAIIEFYRTGYYSAIKITLFNPDFTVRTVNSTIITGQNTAAAIMSANAEGGTFAEHNLFHPGRVRRAA